MAEAQSSKTYTGSFHFVNKDASNLRRRDAKEAFAIGSHVNGRYSKFMRANRAKEEKLHTSVVFRPSRASLGHELRPSNPFQEENPVSSGFFRHRSSVAN